MIGRGTSWVQLHRLPHAAVNRVIVATPLSQTKTPPCRSKPCSQGCHLSSLSRFGPVACASNKSLTTAHLPIPGAARSSAAQKRIILRTEHQPSLDHRAPLSPLPGRGQSRGRLPLQSPARENQTTAWLWAKPSCLIVAGAALPRAMKRQGERFVHPRPILPPWPRELLSCATLPES